MIGELLLLSSFLVATPHAASPAQKPRTLPELVSLCTNEGREDPLSAEMAAALGLPEREVPGRTLRYMQSKSPDKKEHGFTVLYDGASKGPAGLVVVVTKGTKDAGVVRIDGIVYRASLKGDLESATHNSGAAGEVTDEKVTITKAVRKRFKSELDFFLRVAPSLGLDFAR